MGRNVENVVIAEKSDYCSEAGSHYNDRLVNKTQIIAFSDPNDLLSYTIPPQFVDQQLDVRLCIEATNILINVADVHDLLGFGKFANPLTSHTAYSSDDRVIALIAKGIGTPNTSSLVLDKCKWTRLVD